MIVFTAGTGWQKYYHSTYSWRRAPMRMAEAALGGTPYLFSWCGGNSRMARRAAAERLAAYLEETAAARHEPVTLAGFSHGGNVAALAARLVSGSRGAARVANLVTIGTPVLAGYQPLPGVRHVHIYNPRDTVQRLGGEAAFGRFGLARRTFPHAQNIAVDIADPHASGRHGNLLWDERTWKAIGEHVRPRA